MASARVAIAALCSPIAEDVPTTTVDSPPPAPRLASMALAPPATKRPRRRMSNSERGKLYRSRKKSYEHTLTRQVARLQQEVRDLEHCGRLRHELVMAQAAVALRPTWRCPATAPFSKIVCEYFAAFETGLPAADATEPDVLERSPRQAVFFDTLVDEKLQFHESVGAACLFDCWVAHTLSFAALRLDLHHLDVVALEPRPIVVATADLCVRFARKNLAAMFVGILDDPALVERVLPLEVALPVTVRFYFGSDGRINQYHADVDLVAGWTSALGSMREAAELLTRMADDSAGHR